MKVSWLVGLIPVVAAQNASSVDLDDPSELPSEGNFLTLAQFRKILSTEVKEELGVRRLSSLESDELWKSSLEYEWTVAEEREDLAKLGGRRAARGIAEGTSPFIVCDSQYARSGEEALEIITELLGQNLIPLYNKIDMTCFAVEAFASDVSNLPVGLVAAPMTAEMKMGEDLIEQIATSEPMVSRVEAVFCGGETAEDSDPLAVRIYESMVNSTDDRRLRAESFLESRATRDGSRQAYWHRVLGSLDEEVCNEMVSKMTLDYSGDTMTLTLADEHVNNNIYRDCLHAVVADLAVQPESCFIWAYQEIELFNTLASAIIQSGDSQSKPFYDVGLDGRGQVVALSDTGLDTDNCYLWDSRASVGKNKGGNFDLDVRKVVQYYAGSDGMDLFNGHGTHVAGTIVGRKAVNGRTESDGEADGAARAAKLAFYDIGNDAGRLSTPLPDKLFAPGFRAGARLHSASWGTPRQNFYSGFDRAVDAYMYDNPDFLFIVAAGNEGEGDKSNTVGSPAVCKNGIAVGASQNARPHIRTVQKGPDYLAEFSSRGPTRDGRRKPDVVAPGQHMLSAKAIPEEEGECDDTDPKGLNFKAGTSMATPNVAGAAALVRQYFEKGWHISGSADPSSGFSPKASLVKAVLLNGGQELVAVQNGKTGKVTRTTNYYDENQGFGRINLLDSLPIQGKNKITAMFVNGKTIRNGQAHTYQVTIAQNDQCGSLAATLVWTDPPAAPNCNRGCVLNDLDLYITGQGKKFFPNGLNKADNVNNAERVLIKGRKGGQTFTVHVEGTDLLQNQEYSLVITGCFKNEDKMPPDSDGGGDPGEDPNEGSGQEKNCPDGSGRVSIGNGNTRSCSWLASKLDDYGYLCTFRDVALECPSTCSACLLVGNDSKGTDKRTATALDGRNRWFGNMFDIQAKKDITIRHFDVHISRKGQYEVKVYVRDGQLDPQSNEKWNEICSASVTSNGFEKATTIPSNSCNSLNLARNSFLSIYITTVEKADMVMTRNKSTGNALIDNGDLRLRTGVAVTYFDAQSFNNYAFNGAVHYTIPGQCQDNTGAVLVDDTVGERTCSWLSENLDRYAFTCEFASVSVYCPMVCDACQDI